MNIEIAFNESKYQLQLPDSWENVTSINWKAVMHIRQSLKPTYSEIAPKKGSMFSKPRIERTGADYTSYPLFMDALFTAAKWPKKLAAYITPNVCSAIIEEVKWCVDAPEHSTNMLPRIGMFKGVKSQLANMTWEQYGFAEETYQAWRAMTKADDVEGMLKQEKKLFAILYTPFFFWSPLIGDINSKLIWAVSRENLRWCMLNYIGMREWLMNIYSHAFPKSSSQAASSDDSDEYEPSDEMRRLTLSLAGTKFGDIKGTRRANVHDVLIFIDSSALARKKQEAASVL